MQGFLVVARYALLESRRRPVGETAFLDYPPSSSSLQWS